MRVFALNCGSSSVKGVLIDTGSRERLLEMRIEELGTEDGRLVAGADVAQLGRIDTQAAVKRLFAELRSHAGSGDIEAVAHRIVHGGPDFVRPTELDEASLAGIEKFNVLAPLHNPFALEAARYAMQEMPQVPHVAIFDTAFHATLPPRAHTYALPPELARRHGIRRYGFHGISHAQVTRSIAHHLEVEPQTLRIISCHLGNGASVAAVEYGRSVETSMGMTPLEGLVMGTRCGDIDPGVLVYLLEHGGCDGAALNQLLNRDSGLKGFAGTNDLRDIEQRAQQGDEACRLAIGVYAHRVRKYIGAYAAAMGGVDVIVFTGGIGENSAPMRHRIVQRFDFLGARIDEDRNRDARVSTAQPIAEIGEPGMRTRLFVVSANEELEMAEQTEALLHTATAQHAKIPVEVSARHAHLSQATIEKLFGPGYRLRERAGLSQHGQFSAQEVVTLIGPRGRIDNVRLMGPARAQDQVEISRSDEFALGIDAPVRTSGDLRNTPGIVIQGPAGRVTLTNGVICARRHIHMNSADAARLGVRDHQSVRVRIDSDGRDLVFGDVVVRVDPTFSLALHLDTDEANAAGVQRGDMAELLP